MINEKYVEWLNFDGMAEELKNELLKISDSDKYDAFYKNLEFGTGGMRGVMGAGTNRLNKYTIRKATKGLAEYIKKQELDCTKGVVIAYDPRKNSAEYALEAARVLGSAGIKAYIFNSLRPTPVLSFSVREMGALYGIVITASHNPAKYNGYKIYNHFGGQLVPEEVEPIIDEISAIDNELTIEIKSADSLKKIGLIESVPEQIDELYTTKVADLVRDKRFVTENGADLSIVFTPLHGTAAIPLPTALKKAGFLNIHIVKEQEKSDPQFSTVKSPNPEDHAALELAVKYANNLNADIVLATDPDSDRLGVAALTSDNVYDTFTGNQIAALILNYLIKSTSNLKNKKLIKTIVSSELGADIAKKHNVEVIDTLTGFKFIGEKIESFTEKDDFLFGYEESYGYLIGDFTKDKDAIQPAVIISEIALKCKKENKTLWDALDAIYDEYGYYGEYLESKEFDGEAGVKKINQLVENLRENPLSKIGVHEVSKIEDYLSSTYYDKLNGISGVIDLPKSNVIKYIFKDGYWFAVRPSGTEPKVKVYFGSTESNQALCQSGLDGFIKNVDDIFFTE